MIPNATVTITNKATRVGPHGDHERRGLLSARRVPAGDYEVRAEVKGFKTLVRPATVQVGESTQVNMPMSSARPQK